MRKHHKYQTASIYPYLAIKYRLNNKSSVVMKYFVSGRFRLLGFLIATKGTACRELYVWYFDFSVRKRLMRGQHAVGYNCKISTFSFVNGWGSSSTVIFRLFLCQRQLIPLEKWKARGTGGQQARHKIVL